MKTLVISSRSRTENPSKACAHDFEDAIVDALDADLLVNGNIDGEIEPSYDLVIVCAVSFHDMRERLQMMRKKAPIAGRRLGYVFGAYHHIIQKTGLGFVRHFHDWRKEFRVFDRLYLGIAPDADRIAADLGVQTRYVPMAANVMAVAAKPLGPRNPRPIDVNAFGRQHKAAVAAICDRFNRPGSDRIVVQPGLLETRKATDLVRYRDMFWQILRQSQISLNYDQMFADPNAKSVHSYVGPRWWESLAAGTVVLGRAPNTPEARRLLDWEDATIDIPDQPEAAADAVEALLGDRARLDRASSRNLANMSQRHDWRHRLRDILRAEDLPVPPRLEQQLFALSEVTCQPSERDDAANPGSATAERH